jgi:hypothetical protein
VSKSSPVVVGRIAISRVRLRKFTEQLSIVSGNREHNRSNANSAESSAEPKHSQRESRVGFSLWIDSAPQDGLFRPFGRCHGVYLYATSPDTLRIAQQKGERLAALYSRKPRATVAYSVIRFLCVAFRRAGRAHTPHYAAQPAVGALERCLHSQICRWSGHLRDGDRRARWAAAFTPGFKARLVLDVLLKDLRDAPTEPTK